MKYPEVRIIRTSGYCLGYQRKKHAVNCRCYNDAIQVKRRQSDCDKKIRDLADVLLICKRTLRVFVTTKAYQKKVVIVSPKQDNSRDTATMTDDFVALGRLWDWSHPFRAWLPKWVKVHDSFK